MTLRRLLMDYNNLDVDKIVEEVYTAVAEGKTRSMTKQEIMRIRLAALSAIVANMQKIVEADYKSVNHKSSDYKSSDYKSEDHELASTCHAQRV